MPNTYRLINPHVEGNLKTKIKADNSQEAANTLYKTLSEHFNNSVPVFLFSIQKGSSGSGKTYHFKVTEKTSFTFDLNDGFGRYNWHGKGFSKQYRYF